MTRSILAIVGLLVVQSATFAADLPADKVKLQPLRWRAVRQIVQPAAEQAGFRWAIPATVSRKAYVGNNDGTPLPAAELLQALAEQTGLSAEVIGDVVTPSLADREDLDRLSSDGRGYCPRGTQATSQLRRVDARLAGRKLVEAAEP